MSNGLTTERLTSMVKSVGTEKHRKESDTMIRYTNDYTVEDWIAENNPSFEQLAELSGKIAEDKKTLQSRAAALAMHPGANVGAIARAAGVSRQTLYNWISKAQK